MRLVLMGMPGVGKGTQAVRLVEAVGALHVSTGDILREAVEVGSSLGTKVRGFLDSGSLVPDTLVGDLIGERLSRRDAQAGFVLDGFPRTLEQVEILDRVLAQIDVALDRVILLAAPESEIVRRLTGRRVCPNPECGSLYHLENHPPSSAGVCDRCSSALVQRPDDSEDVINNRLRVYEEQTLPIAQKYGERGILTKIDATGDPVVVAERIRATLESL